MLNKAISLQTHQYDAWRKTPVDGGGGKILNWGLGSGKTIGSVALSEKRGGNVLVVTPASLRTNFKQQLEFAVSKDRLKNYKVVSYDEFRLHHRQLMSTWRPKTVIADEFHRVRNAGARKPFDDERKNIPYLIGLTGSLVNNRPEEIVPLANLAAGHRVFPSQKAFTEKYIDKEKIRPGLLGKIIGVRDGVRESIKNEKDLARKLKPVVHRFTGSPEYARHMPKVVEEPVKVVMSPEQDRMYRALSTSNPLLAYRLKHNLPPSKKDLKDMNSFLSAARQISNDPGSYSSKMPGGVKSSPKFKRMVTDIHERAANDKNYRGVVYSNFLSAGVEPIIDELNATGVSAATFTGKLNDRERRELVDKFNAGGVKILGLSPAGGEGLDLKGVRTVQLTEEHWNPERGAQAIGRSARYKSHAHLPKQDRVVDVKRYQAVRRPTIINNVFGTHPPMAADEWIDERRRDKLKLNNQFLQAING